MPANDPLAYVRDARAPMEPAPALAPAPERAPADITALLDSMLMQPAPVTGGSRLPLRQRAPAAPLQQNRVVRPNADVQRLQALKGDLAAKAKVQETAENPFVEILQNKVRWEKKGKFITPSSERIDVEGLWGPDTVKTLGERHLPRQIPVQSLLTDEQYARFMQLAHDSGITDKIPHVIDLGDLDAKQLATVMTVRAVRNIEAAKRIEEEGKKKEARRGR